MTFASRPEPERPATPASATSDDRTDDLGPPPAEHAPGAFPADPPPADHESAPAQPHHVDATPTDRELLKGVRSADAGVEVLVSRARPKYSAFIGVGVVAGLLVAVILTLTRPANPEYSANSVLSYLSLVFGLLGGSVGGVVALALDRRSDRAARSAQPRQD